MLISDINAISSRLMDGVSMRDEAVDVMKTAASMLQKCIETIEPSLTGLFVVEAKSDSESLHIYTMRSSYSYHWSYLDDIYLGNDLVVVYHWADDTEAVKDKILSVLRQMKSDERRVV